MGFVLGHPLLSIAVHSTQVPGFGAPLSVVSQAGSAAVGQVSGGRAPPSVGTK
jgi:hypothetical protein